MTKLLKAPLVVASVLAILLPSGTWGMETTLPHAYKNDGDGQYGIENNAKIADLDDLHPKTSNLELHKRQKKRFHETGSIKDWDDIQNSWRYENSANVGDLVTHQDMDGLDCLTIKQIIINPETDENQKLEQIKMALKNTILNINSGNFGVWNGTILHFVAQNGYAAIVAFLVNNGANINIKNFENETPIFAPIRKNDLTITKFFIDQGIDLTTQNFDGQAVIHVASYHQNSAAVKLLVENGVDINSPDGYKSPPIHWAIEHTNRPNPDGALETVKFIVSHKANLANIDLSANAYYLPCVRHYLELATDFYQVKDKKMAFSDFAKKYLAGEQAAQNCADVTDLLHLGTKAFAREFYEWRKQNNNMGTNIKSYQQMLFNSMEKTTEIGQKITLLPLIFPFPSTSNNVEMQFNDYVVTESTLPLKDSITFKKSAYEYIRQNNLRHIVCSDKGPHKRLCDITILFKK